MNVSSAQVFDLSFFFASQDLQFELLNPQLDILTLFEVLVDHENSLVFTVPAQACLHAKDLAICEPREKRGLASGIKHVNETLHGQKERKVIRSKVSHSIWQSELLLNLLCLNDFLLSDFNEL